MTNFVVYPKGIEFKDWASQIRTTITTLDFPIPLPGSIWRDWAYQMFIMHPNDMAGVPHPDEVAFPKESDWSKWASFLVFTLMNR